ncbi:hypothetical protein [Frigoribacterium sp. VKM Ac-2836]|uniref:hypothetical protein n=1 Tax=Frigoribacterium sp. VKM Ac-2836 TaxID=2739014 RepID=UPI0015676F8B|nr:hypothetical protein [Frigoribacterium sp. VKM Ac-2836]NRD26332.1 hypothetical protein [Frigoribacterium sp. VKM Ac-2836]
MQDNDVQTCEFNCLDRAADRLFDEAMAVETKFGVNLTDLLDNHDGWYLEPSEDGIKKFVQGLGLDKESGVYVLWRAIGFCDVHDKEVYDAVYVGKTGIGIGTRLRRHLEAKRLGNGMPVEVTTWRGSNRQAKFVEQLLLDIFAFEANRQENPGTARLHVTVDPAAWN